MAREEREKREMNKARTRVALRQQKAACTMQRFSRGFLARLVKLCSTRALRSKRRMPSVERPVMRHLLLGPADVIQTSGLGRRPPAPGEGLPRDAQLYFAARDGNFEAVTRLVSSGANVHYRDPWNGFTPLVIAAYRSHAIIVALLLSRGASAMARTHGGLTALHWAAGFGDADVCDVLRTRGRADPHALDGHGESAIGRAERNSRTMLASKLREGAEERLSGGVLTMLAQANAMMHLRRKLVRAVRQRDERRREEDGLSGNVLLERRRALRQSKEEQSRSRHASKEL
jgi:hypothetical protein